MNTPIDQRTPVSPTPSAPARGDNKRATQPFYKANTLPKPNANQGPGHDAQKAPKIVSPDADNSLTHTAKDKAARRTEEPKQS